MHLIYNCLYKFIYKVCLFTFTKKTVNFLKNKKVLKFTFIDDKFIYKNPDLAYSFLYKEGPISSCLGDFDNFNYNAHEFNKDTLEFLHSFEWLQHLKSIDSKLASEKIYELLNTWILNYGNCESKVAFSLPVLSKRLFNWLSSERILLLKNSKFQNKFLESLSLQVRIFLKIYDFNRDDQSLLINTTLFVVGKAIESHKITEIALNRIIEFLENNVLADGGIYDKSPSYILDNLEKVLFVYKNLSNVDSVYQSKLRPFVDKMIIFIKSVSYKDGGLGVFNGGHEEDSKRISFLLSLGGINADPFKQLRYSGYLNLKSGEKIDILLKTNTNISNNNIKKNIANSNSILSQEIILQGKRIFVNNGMNSCLEDNMHKRDSYSTMLFFDKSNTLINMPQLIKEHDCKIFEKSSNDASIITATYKGLENIYGVVWHKSLILAKKESCLLGEELLTFKSGYSLVKFGILKFILHPSVVLKETRFQDCMVILEVDNEEWVFKSDKPIMVNNEIYKGIKNEVYPTISLNININKNAHTIEWFLIQTNLYKEKVKPFMLKDS